MEKNTKIQNYIKLVYSEQSELRTITNLHERKFTACQKAGLNPKDEKVIKMMNMEDEKTRDQIIDYLCENESNEMMSLNSDQQLFWDIQAKIMAPLTTMVEDEERMLKTINLKTTMSEKSQELLTRMNLSYLKIFKGEKEVAAAKKKVKWTFLEQRIKRRDDMKKAEEQKKPAA